MACSHSVRATGDARNPHESRKLIREKDTASRPNLLALPRHNFSCGVMVLRATTWLPARRPARAVRRAICDSCIVDRNLDALLVFVHNHKAQSSSAPGDLMKVTTSLWRWAGIGALALGLAPAVFAQGGAFGGGFGPPLQAVKPPREFATSEEHYAYLLEQAKGGTKHTLATRAALGRSLAAGRQHASRDLHRRPGLQPARSAKAC